MKKRRHLNEAQRALVTTKIATMRQGERIDDLKPSTPSKKVEQRTSAAKAPKHRRGRAWAIQDHVGGMGQNSLTRSLSQTGPLTPRALSQNSRNNFVLNKQSDRGLCMRWMPTFVKARTGAAALKIAPGTWHWKSEHGELPPPCPGFPSTNRHWRWGDVIKMLGDRVPHYVNIDVMLGDKVSLKPSRRVPHYVNMPRACEELDISLSCFRIWVRDGILPPQSPEFPPTFARWAWPLIEAWVSGDRREVPGVQFDLFGFPGRRRGPRPGHGGRPRKYLKSEVTKSS